MASPNPAGYLGSCKNIDFTCPAIAKIASRLAAENPAATAKRCFEFVRDEIKHSSDYQLNPVTCKASDALEYGTGYCYAKSHLLCALLRANKIPAGLCYQRLSIDGSGPPFCLHGLNAIYLPEHGWYRIDARGNRDDCADGKVDAQFDPPTERLAFSTDLPGEYDLPEIHASPRPEVTAVLSDYSTWDAVLQNLPDVNSAE